MAKDDLFDEEEHGMVRMTFGEHLEDLRRRLILSLIGLVPAVIVGFLIGGRLVEEMKRPVESALRQYYEQRLQEKRAALQQARKDGKPLRRERLLLRMNRDSLRGAVQQAFPELENAVADEKPAANSSDGNAASQAGPSSATAPEARSPPGPVVPPQDDLIVEMTVEVDHDELEIASAGEYYRTALLTLSAQESFMAFMKVSFVAGLVIASWWIIYQLWQFVAEGLYQHERRVVYRAMPFSVGLFLVGVFFCFFAVLPGVLKFFFSFNKWFNIEPTIRLSEWLGFATLLPVIFGVCFELPLVMLVLERVGIFQFEDYTSKWRHALLGIAVIAMIVTPTTDPGSMMMLMGPMTALYGLGLALVRLRHGGLKSLGAATKLRVVVASFAVIYALTASAGFWLPDRWIGRERWFDHVWKLAMLPTSYFLQSRLSLDDTNWLWGVTLVNTLIVALVMLRLGELILKLTHGKGRR